MIGKRPLMGLMAVWVCMGSAVAHAESATISCFLMGDYPDANPTEKDRLSALSFVVDGVQADKPGEQVVRTNMIADRHKLLGGYVINKVVFAKSGTIFLAEQPDSRAVMIMVPEADGKSAKRSPAVLRGIVKGSADFWANMDGICSIILTADGAYNKSFLDGVYPLVEQSADEEFRQLQRAGK